MSDLGDRIERAEAPADGLRERMSELAERRFAACVGGLAVGGGALAGVALTREGMWNDELQTLAVADRGFGAFVHLLPHRQNGILYDLLVWPIAQLGGTSPFALRLPSLIAFAAAVALCALVGARLATRAIGLLAGLFLALSPFAVYYAQEARPYALVLFCVLLSAWLLLRAAERPSAWRFVAYAASVVLVGYAHDFALLSVLAQPFLLLGSPRRVWIGFVASLCAVGLLFLPAVFFIPDNWAQTAFYWVQSPRHYLRPTVRFLFGSPVTLVIAAATLGAGAVALWRRLAARQPVPYDARLPTFAAVLTAAPFAVLVLYSLHRPVYVPRYVIEAAGGLALALAAAVAILPRRVALPCGAAVAVALLFSAVRVDVQLTKHDWPAVAATIDTRGADRQIVLVGDSLQNANGLFYYSPVYGIDRRHLLFTRKDAARLPARLLLAHSGDEVASFRQAAASGPFWVVESGFVPDAATARMNAFLDRCATHGTQVFREITLVEAAGCPAG